jgi:hypothetical protein
LQVFHAGKQGTPRRGCTANRQIVAQFDAICSQFLSPEGFSEVFYTGFFEHSEKLKTKSEKLKVKN